MKLLVLAQTPPPLHGQSLMVQTAVVGLPRHGIEVHHVNLRLSRSHADIGGWRPGKILAVLDACFHAIVARFTAGCDTLYYVPAPAKRGALYRDWIVMALCRPFFRRLVLHFHNGGLGEWIEKKLTAPERALTRALLGRADLAIVLADALRADAEALAPRAIEVVANGIAAPQPRMSPPPASPPFNVLFLGACSEEKGLFVAAEAVLAANRQLGRHNVVLTAAGSFTSAGEAQRFAALASSAGGALRHVDFARGAALEQLWAETHCLCVPTHYAHEAQPLVVIEALARGVPVVATAWRAIPDTVLHADARLVPIRDVPALTEALLAARGNPNSGAAGRSVYERRFTIERHLSQLGAVLRNLSVDLRPTR